MSVALGALLNTFRMRSFMSMICLFSTSVSMSNVAVMMRNFEINHTVGSLSMLSLLLLF